MFRALEMDKSFFHARDIQRWFLHSIGRESHLGDRAQAFVHREGPPVAEFRVLHFVDAGVGHDGLVHQVVCSIGNAGLQPGKKKQIPRCARDDKP